MSHEGAPRGGVVDKLPAIAVGASVKIFRCDGHDNCSCALGGRASLRRVASRTRCRAVPRASTPTTSRGGKQEHDATYDRRPAHYDPKELLLDVTERSKPDMQWCERHCYDKHPKRVLRKEQGLFQDISYEYLTNIVGHRKTSR